MKGKGGERARERLSTHRRPESLGTRGNLHCQIFMMPMDLLACVSCVGAEVRLIRYRGDSLVQSLHSDILARRLYVLFYQFPCHDLMLPRYSLVLCLYHSVVLATSPFTHLPLIRNTVININKPRSHSGNLVQKSKVHRKKSKEWAHLAQRHKEK